MTFLKKKKSTILSFRCLTPHEAQHQINCCVGVVLWSAIFLLRKINSAVISDNGTRLSVKTQKPGCICPVSARAHHLHTGRHTLAQQTQHTSTRTQFAWEKHVDLILSSGAT